MSTPANFNGARPVIDVNDTAMLLIDHQSGLFQTVGDMPMPELRCSRRQRWPRWPSLAGIPGDHAPPSVARRGRTVR